VDAYWHYCEKCERTTPNYYNGLDLEKQNIIIWCKCCRSDALFPNSPKYVNAFKKTWMSGPIPNQVGREYGWIYVGLDLLKPERFKIGETRLVPEVRERDRTTNPEYRIHTAYAVPLAQRKLIEKQVHRLCAKRGIRIEFPNEKKAEWFEISYKEAIRAIEEVLVDVSCIDDLFQDDSEEWCFHRIKHVEPQFEPHDVLIPEIERM